MGRIKKAIDFLFAEGEDFSLEHRLFLSATIIGTLTSVLGAILNLLLDASLLAVFIPLFLSVLLLTLYYFLRFRKIFQPFVVPGIMISFFGISIIWMTNGGMNGVNVMPAFVILILGLVTVPDKKKKYVILLFLLLFAINYFIQYYYPQLILSLPHDYNFWFDSVVTFFYSSIFIYLIVKFIHKHYTLERKKSQENEERYRVLTENMKDVVWIIDAETLRYIYVSPSVKKLRGFTPEEIMGNTLDSEFPPEDAEQIKTHFLQRMGLLLSRTDNQPRYYTDELRHLHKDGSIVHTEVVHEYYINEKNNRIEIRGVTRDISERRKAEQRIRNQNIELNSLNAEKDRFLSIIAHDLKSPFHSIIGLSDFLVKKVDEKDIESIGRYAETIRQASHRVMDLLSNLMLWSYSQTGRTRFNPEHILLRDLVNEVLMLFYETTLQKSITIRTEIPTTTNAYADKAMVGTILRNLISNAIKFSHIGGTITIKAENNSQGLVVKVCDNGVGVPAEKIGNLFRIDKNHSTPGTQNEQGTGLGLILCKDFVEKHGGSVWVESETDKGSTFSFTIPPEFS